LGGVGWRSGLLLSLGGGGCEPKHLYWAISNLADAVSRLALDATLARTRACLKAGLLLLAWSSRTWWHRSSQTSEDPAWAASAGDPGCLPKHLYWAISNLADAVSRLALDATLARTRACLKSAANSRGKAACCESGQPTRSTQAVRTETLPDSGTICIGQFPTWLTRSLDSHLTLHSLALVLA
jgi:hypothetical protein